MRGSLTVYRAFHGLLFHDCILLVVLTSGVLCTNCYTSFRHITSGHFFLLQCSLTFAALEDSALDRLWIFSRVLNICADILRSAR